MIPTKSINYVSMVNSATVVAPSEHPTQVTEDSARKNKIGLDDIETVANLIKILRRNPQDLHGVDYKQSQIVKMNKRKFSNSDLRKIKEILRNNDQYDYYSEDETSNPNIMELIKNAVKIIKKENTRKVSINRKYGFTTDFLKMKAKI